MQTFEPTDLKYTYSPEHAPIGTVSAGETFAVITADCFTGRYENAANFPHAAGWVEDHLDGVTGPIAVEGAEPGHAVEVRIESVQVTTPGYVVISRCEAVSPADWWHEEDHVIHLAVDGDQIVLSDDWRVPVAPLIGCLATAPARETVLSRHEGAYLGNVDVREITDGATVVLPVAVPSAGLYFGDCKAAMGDGEVVCAPEVGARIIASARPVQRPVSMGAPRVMTEDLLMTVVSGISLADACRAAFAELKSWLQDEWELSSDQAAVVMGIGAHCGVGQVSNLLHTAKCSIARALLPNRIGQSRAM
jgi:amidase